MKLQHLLQGLTDYPVDPANQITGISLHSQQIQPGELFVAQKGQQKDGHIYIQQAIEQGARAVIGDPLVISATDKFPSPVPVIPIPQLENHLGTLAKRFYGEPSQEVQVTGVTGTNGKTTTTFLLAQSLSKLGVPTAVVGTVGYGFINQLYDCALTTPDIISLSKYLYHLKKKGAKAVAMEVSSHGLTQNRVKNIAFASAIFTNLTQDHLDYHGSMEAYGRAKQKLFQFSTLQRAILNADSPYAEKILPTIYRDIPVALYSLHEHRSISTRRNSLFLTAKDIILNQKGMTAVVKTPWGQGVLRSPLLGAFNLSNLLAVLAELCLCGNKLEDALSALSAATAPPGRMQRFGGVRTPQVIVDYAHTPDALENALKAARLHCERKLWCVFGCGGDRDKDKRSKMGRVAEQYADRIVITNDNPRTEDPRQIIEEIMQGLTAPHKIIIEENRQTAIEYAIHHALPVDTILIAGKGHENYQIIGEQRLPFSDVQCVKTFLNEDNHEVINHR